MGGGADREILAEKLVRTFRARFLCAERAGGRLPSVRDLASELGVSVPTIRAVQARLAEQGLLEIRHGSGVYVCDRKAASPVVGIYTNLDVFHPATSHYHRQVIRALRLWFEARGVQAEVYVGESEVDEDRELRANSRFARDVAEGHLGGLALLNVPETHAWARWADELAIPAVGALTEHVVVPDHDHMVREGVRVLREQGCERIALLCWDFPHLQMPFEQVLAEAGCAYHPDWVRGNLHPMLKGAGWEEFREIWASRREKPDGLLVGDDLLFTEACVAIQEMGIRVPEQLRLVAHANKGATQALPLAHTRLEIDPEDEAEAYGEMLLALMRGETPSHEHATITCKVVSMPGVVNEGRGARRAAVAPDFRDGFRETAGWGTAGTSVSRVGGVQAHGEVAATT